MLSTSRETSEQQRTWALAPTQSGSREGGHGGLARLISWSVGVSAGVGAAETFVFAG